MRLAWLALVAALGCSKKPGATPPAQGSGSAVGSAAAAAPAPAAPAAAAGVLAFDPPDDSGEPDPRAIAFGGKIPRLPAVSADGTLYAEYDMSPMAMEVDLIVHRVGGKEILTHETILSDDEAQATASSDGWSPALKKTLADRGAKAMATLQGFHSLEQVDTSSKDPNSGGGDVPTKIGELTLDPDLGELRDAQGRVLHSEVLPAYSTSDCKSGYRPMFRWAYRDSTNGMLYVDESYHYMDDCMAPPAYIFAWSTDPAKGDLGAMLRGLIAHQFDAKPAFAVTTNGKPVDELLKTCKPAGESDATVTLSRDGNSAWGDETAGDIDRASSVLVKTPKGWQLAAAAWTEPVGNDDANRDAKAGKLHPAKLDGDPGDQGLRDAFAKLTTDGVDAAAAARTDLVAIGSGFGERTVGGAGFARAWNAGWKGKVTVVSSVAHATPSGTTGWVTASVELAKHGYQMPFTVFAVFDKTADGHWSLVHIHFAV
jgi:ketosteroid isomerase-like protein